MKTELIEAYLYKDKIKVLFTEYTDMFLDFMKLKAITIALWII